MEYDIAKALSTRCFNIYKEKLSEYFRVNRLDPSIHIADINFEALKTSDPELTGEEYAQILKALRNSFGANVMSSAKLAVDNMVLGKSKKEVGTKLTQTKLVLGDPTFGNLIVAPTYDTLQKRVSPIFKELANSYSDVKKLLGTDDNGNTVINIGHIYSKSSTSTRTPLSSRIENIIKIMPSGARGLLNSFLQDLETQHFKVSASCIYTRNDISKTARNGLLARGAVLVTIQSVDINQKFLANEEKRIEKELEAFLQSQEFIELLMSAPGSMSIKDEVAWAIGEVIRTGKLPKTYHNSKAGSVAQEVLSKRNISTSKIVLPKRIKSSTRSLTNLQVLINSLLHDQIQSNMGTGSSHNVLNYRTGRLASSAVVQRLTVSKEGMITAFYTYMKNPYAVFSTGGPMSYPTSRDPKLLISKSIREIAAKVVTNRMRAVTS